MSGSECVASTGKDDFRRDKFQLSIALPSGQTEIISIPPSSKVGDLTILAQKTFGSCGFLRLLTASGHALTDSVASLSAAGLQDRDHLTALAVQGSIAATQEAFALWCCGGDRIVAWGIPDSGGDNSAIQDLLRNVQQVKALENRIPCWCHAHRCICGDSGRWLRHYMGGEHGRW